MYFYYKYSHNHKHLENIHEVSFRKVTPKANSVHSILWHILSFVSGGEFIEYQLITKDGKVASVAQVCPKLPIFPFIEKSGWHIGPCKTVPEERGKGFYPLLLQHILEDNPNRLFFMIVEENNISSQKGVAKVNFEKFAVGYKKFGRYIIK